MDSRSNDLRAYCHADPFTTCPCKMASIRVRVIAAKVKGKGVKGAVSVSERENQASKEMKCCNGVALLHVPRSTDGGDKTTPPGSLGHWLT